MTPVSLRLSLRAKDEDEQFVSFYPLVSAVKSAYRLWSRMNIIVRMISGALQDAYNNSYHRVVIVYGFLSRLSVVVSAVLVLLAWWAIEVGHMQWMRKQRIAKGDLGKLREAAIPRRKRSSKQAYLQGLLR